MNRKKVLVAEVELSIGRIYEREIDQPGYEARSVGKPRSPHPDIVILDILQHNKDRCHLLMRRILGENHKLAVVLTSDSLNDDFTFWSADAHILHGSRLENLKNAM